MSAVANAALPVAVVLLVLTATARGVLWADIDDPAWQRTAREYLEPLSTLCVGAAAVNVVASGAAGDVGLGMLVPLALGAAAVFLRSERAAEAPAVETVAQAPEPAPSRAPAGSLWARERQ